MKIFIWITLSILILVSFIVLKKYQKKKFNNKIINIINNKAEKTLFITDKTIFVFDIDEVILNYDYKKAFNIILKSNKYDLLRYLFYPRLLYYIYSSRGIKTIDEIIIEITKTSSELKNSTEIAFQLGFSKKIDMKTAEFINYLKNKNYKLIILSNETYFDFEILKKQHPLFNLFDEQFLTSSKDNFIKKPDPQFYDNFLTWCKTKNLDPKNMIFIDDKLENVIMGNIKGIPSVVFKDADNLKKVLFNHE